MACAIVTIGSLLLAEAALRLLVPTRGPLGTLTYETPDGMRIASLPEAVQHGFIEMLVPPLVPRPRGRFRPGLDFFLCYADHELLRRSWFDERGRVPVHINAAGIRDRDDLGFEKPVGQRRLLCLGDSFTFGWGVRDEDGWVRRVETALRTGGADIRTVNCGAAGALCVDEYRFGLENRFHAFQPDAVLVTLYPNDLVPSSGLYVQGPSPATGVRVFDLVLGALGRSPLDLDPAIDWVGILKGLPEAEGTKAELYGNDKPFAAMWSQGVPQASLAAMKAWCGERKIPLMVTLWPFLQGLGPARQYPFRSLHQEVAELCGSLTIPFLDVQPVLASIPAEDLWVTPADMHANPKAHALAEPAITEFVRRHTGW